MDKNPEANFISKHNIKLMHLDVLDFFEYPERKIYHMIDNGSIQT